MRRKLIWALHIMLAWFLPCYVSILHSKLQYEVGLHRIRQYRVNPRAKLFHQIGGSLYSYYTNVYTQIEQNPNGTFFTRSSARLVITANAQALLTVNVIECKQLALNFQNFAITSDTIRSKRLILQDREGFPFSNFLYVHAGVLRRLDFTLTTECLGNFRGCLLRCEPIF